MDTILERIYNKNFPEKTKTIKSSDPPWMNARVKRAAEKKRKFYRRKGNSANWKNLCDNTEAEVKAAKENFIGKVKNTVKTAKNSAAFFKALPFLTSKASPKPWNIRSLFPEMSDEQIANKCAGYFSEISQEYEAIEAPVPAPENAEWRVDLHEISSLLRYCKKPKSMVKGDIRPELVSKCHDVLAIPLFHIYNSMLSKCQWPDSWKMETVKIIPKSSIPQSLKDVRNISCTPLFSKVLEQIVLKKLREHMELPKNQFGGVPGVGIDHFLVKTWHEVLNNLEDPGAAASLVSIDFSKAFNRMDHGACMNALERKEVPPHVRAVIQAFLFDRKMAVHVNGKISDVKRVPGGAPQGSVMGSVLFCIATECLLTAGRYEDDFDENGVDVPDEEDQGGERAELEPMSPIAPPDNTFTPLWADLEVG